MVVKLFNDKAPKACKNFETVSVGREGEVSQDEQLSMVFLFMSAGRVYQKYVYICRSRYNVIKG